MVVVALLVLVAPAAATAGSTSPTTSRYETQMRAVGPSLGRALRAVAAAKALASHYPAKPTAARSAAATLAPLPKLLHIANTQLRSIHPPAGARALHLDLVRGSADLARELPSIVARLQRGYLTAGKRLATLPGVQELSSGVSTLGKHGYRIGVGRL
jgi:hypothetical protein